MTVYIDADGCPVVDVTIKIAKDLNAKCVLVCDTSHIIKKDGVKTITVAKGADSVDFALVNMINEGDIVVTQDYGLAAMCLARKGIPINQNGFVYSDKNIDDMLMKRYAAKKIRMAGGKVKGPSKRISKQDVAFGQSLKSLLSS